MVKVLQLVSHHMVSLFVYTNKLTIGWQFIRLYEQLKEKYDYGIAIHASSELTGTYQSSVNAAKQTGFHVEVIDAKIGAYALGQMIKRGLNLQRIGKDFKEIVETIRTLPEKAEMFLLPSSLNQLKRSGRVSTTQAVFASLLRSEERRVGKE